MASPAGPLKHLNWEKIKAKIGSIVEEAPYVVGRGGLACTDKESYAGARASLILVALQTYPVLMMRKEFPEDFRISSIIEVDPRVKLSHSNAVFIRPDLDGSPNHICVAIPCRSEASLKLLLPDEILKRMFRALALWRYPEHGTVMEAYEHELYRFLDQELRAKWKVPSSLAHLRVMQVIPDDYIAEYNRYVAVEAPAGRTPAAPVPLSTPVPGPTPASEGAPDRDVKGEAVEDDLLHCALTSTIGGAGSTSSSTPPDLPDASPRPSTSSTAGTPAVVSSLVRRGAEISATRGSAVSLWWPIRPEAITFDSALSIMRDKREEAETRKGLDAVVRRENMRTAALARFNPTTPTARCGDADAHGVAKKPSS